MKQPSKIASNILNLIDRDVVRIKEEFENMRLDIDTALTLTRYLKSVYDAKDDQETELKKHGENLSKLSNKELKDMALAILNKKIENTSDESK